MNVEIIVTRTCHHCRTLESELKAMGIPYSVRYIKEDKEFQKKYQVKGSPNIMVNGELVFRGMPAISDLREYFKKNNK